MFVQSGTLKVFFLLKKIKKMVFEKKGFVQSPFFWTFFLAKKNFQCSTLNKQFTPFWQKKTVNNNFISLSSFCVIFTLTSNVLPISNSSRFRQQFLDETHFNLISQLMVGRMCLATFMKDRRGKRVLLSTKFQINQNIKLFCSQKKKFYISCSQKKKVLYLFWTRKLQN